MYFFIIESTILITGTIVAPELREAIVGSF